MEVDKEERGGLTPAQRYFYDVNGYVLLEGVFSPDGRRVAYTSDATGWPQAYVVEVPD